VTSEERKQMINRILIEEFEIDPTLLTPQASLQEKLGLDSLDAVDLVVSVERKFHCRLDEQQIKQMRCVQDIYDYVERFAASAPGNTAVVAKMEEGAQL
jgi:acyl carrier protein